MIFNYKKGQKYCIKIAKLVNIYLQYQAVAMFYIYDFVNYEIVFVSNFSMV